MKLSKIILIGLLFIGLSCHAQKFYIRGGLGVAVSTSASYTPDYNFVNNSYTVSLKKQGLGTGLPVVLAAGYKLNEHFGFELGVDYFYGFPLKQHMDQAYTYYSTNDSKWRGQMLSIVPAFVLSLPLKKVNPYARLGLKLGVMNSVVYEDHQAFSTSVKATAFTDIQSKSKEFGGIAIGAQGAVGTDLVLSSLISLFVEIQVDGISYSPTHGKNTEYIQDGVDVMSSRPVKQKEWEYKKEIAYPNTIPDDQPNQLMKKNYYFGNVGMLVGVKIKL
jgi:hypothetical protein